jgi:hypothetical protein
MTTFQSFHKELMLATSDLRPEAINSELAKYARYELANAISSGQASSVYDKYVNGRYGIEEEKVVAPGPILYEFSYWRPIIDLATNFIIKRSPKKSGRYVDSHKLMVGSQYIRSPDDISPDEEVVIVNTQPYSRKIEVGFMQMSVPDGIYRDAAKLIRSQYGKIIRVKSALVKIPNGYILKGTFTRGRKRYARTKLSSDTQAGSEMTYPAIIMRMI